MKKKDTKTEDNDITENSSNHVYLQKFAKSEPSSHSSHSSHTSVNTLENPSNNDQYIKDYQKNPDTIKDIQQQQIQLKHSSYAEIFTDDNLDQERIVEDTTKQIITGSDPEPSSK